jgi:YD repeat-containing protein
MGIKNRNGSPINPAISPFGIYDYDDIKLSGYDVNNNPATVTYYLSGNQQAILALTYDGSGNLTEAHRTA